MKLVLRIGAAPARRWHLTLLERLGAIPGVQPTLALSGPAPRAAARLHGLDRDGAFAPLPASAFHGWTGNEPKPDLVLDLGNEAAEGEARHWQLLFDGRPGEMALIDALTASRAPVVEIMEGTAVAAAGRIGTDRGDDIKAALADVLDRVVTLVVAALQGGATHLPDLPNGYSSARPRVASLARVLARERAGAAVGSVYRKVFNSPHWRIGWRRLDGPDLYDLRRHPDGGWHELPDDGSRFYADPFPILHRERLTLFVEDFPHATGKGIISAVEFGPDGPLGRPEPALEQDGHLSYPFVFARDGEVWMIPESCSAGRVDLFRATAFPGGWVREATLIDGVTASDATLIEHAGRWWLFATVRDGGAYSDALHLWSAPDFRGPWTAHRRNPVLIDIASARPAGAMVLRDGALFRPVQDCRRGYGRALAIARVTRLDDEGFDQRVETILTSGPLWPGNRLHSLNSAGGFEFIDGSARARKRLF